MKLLHVQIIHELPEDFQGTFEAAMQSFLDHLKSPDLPPLQVDSNFNISSVAFTQNKRYGFKTIADIGVWSLRDGAAWERETKVVSAAHYSGNVFIK